MQAREELRRRGWSTLRRWFAMAAILPWIAPERVMRHLDPARDDGEDTGTPGEVLFSALFSMFFVGVAGTFATAYLIVAKHDSSRSYSWWPLVAWFIIAVTSGWAARVVARRQV